MVVDEARVDPPTNKWLAAQRATDTDGILENASVKRQKVCISMAFHATRPKALLATHAQECTKEGFLQKHECEFTIVKKMNEKEHPKGLSTSTLPPKSLPNHCRGG